ncbi:heat shock 70 kDa protein, mitochondrial-like isoform X2 [Phragmites australis]|uniref:heat shock 70 kDa protein, mitochondrial-like isoform X2 n=1 Tax=Phragmites australis TaxID=29695 RepID=UPI002D78A45E|nr:heat shock 70 kDa protein, mitochondrial-like isoform X2 [Phragmites australis]
MGSQYFIKRTEGGVQSLDYDFGKPSSAMSIRLLRTKMDMFRHCMRGCVTFSTVQPKIAAVGIDIGSKNSRVAITDSLVPRVVDSEIGRYVPSNVTFAWLKSDVWYAWALQHLDSVGKCVAVGELAKRRMLRWPSNVVFNIKSLIGMQFDDYYVQEMRKKVPFSIIEGPREEAWVEIHGMKFSPIEIASTLFAKLKDVVLMDQFHDKLKVVISVPTFFSDQQREGIKSAGERAGLEVLKVIDEPKAAALSSTTIKEGNVVVFGMGSGSYSVSILHVSGTNIKIITQIGDRSVGGDLFDNILVDYFVKQIMELYSVDIRGDKYAMMILAEVAEQAKVGLSSQHEVTVSIPYVTASTQGPVDLHFSISRPDFEKLVHNLVEIIEDKCQSILKESNFSHEDINEVVLMGGMTRVPKIRRIISKVFGKHHSTRVNPEEAVVIGSAIQAALIVEDEREISEDMIPLSIGIESAKGVFTRVIPRHTTIPTKRMVRVPVWCSYGESLHIRIFLGEHVRVDNNKLLGEVELISYRSSYQGSVDIELTFEVDANFVVTVTARYADDQLEGADVRKAFSVLSVSVRKEVMCKQSVFNDVKDALLDWPMHVTRIHAHLRNQARYLINSLGDVLSVRKDDLPTDLHEDAIKALADLHTALEGDVDVLKDKILYATSVQSTVVHWTSPSESGGCAAARKRQKEEMAGADFDSSSSSSSDDDDETTTTGQEDRRA